MGGTIAVTLRLSDGTEHRMARWTNPLPSFVGNARFFAKDPNHIAEWMKQWHDMRADYLKHKDDQNFEHPMTPAYADYTLLAPTGYGLVVLDMQRNFILDSQGYTNFDTRHYFLPDEEDLVELMELVKAGHATKIATDFKAAHEKRFTPVTADDLRTLEPGWILPFDNHGPFTHIRYKEGDPTALRAFKAKVIDLGFALTEEEDREWESFIAGGEEG